VATILKAEGIGLHPTVAPAEFRQVCDYLNRLIKAYGSNFDSLNSSIAAIEGLEADLQEYILFADDGTTTYALRTRAGDYISYNRTRGILEYAKTITSTYTAIPSDKILFASGTFTITMPTVVGNDGRVMVIKNISTGTVTVDGAGSETIDGSANIDLIQDESIILVSDGISWRIV
jgi:hypothetical protein